MCRTVSSTLHCCIFKKLLQFGQVAEASRTYLRTMFMASAHFFLMFCRVVWYHSAHNGGISITISEKKRANWRDSCMAAAAVIGAATHRGAGLSCRLLLLPLGLGLCHIQHTVGCPVAAIAAAAGAAASMGPGCQRHLVDEISAPAAGALL